MRCIKSKAEPFERVAIEYEMAAVASPAEILGGAGNLDSAKAARIAGASIAGLIIGAEDMVVERPIRS